jgi:hypothetical protein
VSQPRQLLEIVNVHIRNLHSRIRDARRGRASVDELLKLHDELENYVDALITALAPERITDERFASASEELKNLTGKLREFRECIVRGKYTDAEFKLTEVHSAIRHIYRVFTVIRAGAPTPLIYQLSPSAPLFPPEVILHTSPLALQAYNLIVRRGEMTLQDIIAELKADPGAVSSAVQELIRLGYVRLYLTPDNKWVLRPVR